MLRALGAFARARVCGLGLGCVSSGLALLLCAEARAQSSELPATLPDDAPAPTPSRLGPPLRFEASLNVALSVPAPRNPDVAGFGFALTYGVGWDEIPLALGLDFASVSSIGDASLTTDLALMEGAEPAERSTSTRLLHFDAWLRLQPAHWVVRPYGEGFIGAQLFQGKYLFHVGPDASDLAQSEAWLGSWGWGAGVELCGLLNRAGTLSLTLGMRRVYGETVRVARSVVVRNQRVETRYEADTSVWLFMLGIGLHYEMSDPHPSSSFLGE